MNNTVHMPASAAKFRHLAVRIHYGAAPAIGSEIPNSWHNSDECDWVDENTELDGACCFPLDAKDEDSIRNAIAFAGAQWPGNQTILLIGSNSRGEMSVPEDGGGLLCSPTVLAVWQEVI